MKNSYYKIVRLIDKPNKNFELAIKWNVREISNDIHANGFIVQHMSINSSHKFIPSNNYYEAWLVKDGIISSDDKTSLWDDKWAA